MNAAPLYLHDLSFTYPGASEPVFHSLHLTLPAGWTGIVGANGAGKTTLLHVAAGLLRPTEGSLKGAGGFVCSQRTDDPPEGLADLLRGPDSAGWAWRNHLSLDSDWFGRWDTLSHGERKRAQLAVALWRNPPLLAVDEPTNHVDVETTALVARALHAYRGIGLLVSHDRRLLDDLCAQCVFLEGGQGVLRPGRYSEGAAQDQRERDTLRQKRALADHEVRMLREEECLRRQQVARGERARSKRGLAPGDSDGRAKIDHLRVADGKSGASLRQLDGRLAQAEARRADLGVKREFSLGVVFHARPTPRSLLLVHPGGSLPLGPARRLDLPALVVRPGERIGLSGPSGAGKTTLVEALLAGSTLSGDLVIHLPQELDRAEARSVLTKVRALSRQRLGQVMALVRRLGSDPNRLLQSQEPSPGELRKLLIACALLQAPCLLVLDEPTNHLDLPSVECLEEALDAFEGALLLVSHDARFLARLTRRRWLIQPGGRDRMVLGEA
jgi:ATPase subunit of ABC transporter with duplicated ATPase domains